MSSPFVDHPHEAVSRLEFEVSLANTERHLLEESKRQLQLQYEALLLAKNDELEAMRTNVEYLAGQRDAVASKLSNVVDTSGRQIEQLQEAAAADRRELARVRRRHDEVEAQAREAACREEQARNRAEGAEREARQLRERCRELQQQNARLAHQPTPVAPVAAAPPPPPPPRADAALHTKVAVLEKTNALLSIKVDQLLQHKTSVEVLRQKNHEMARRLALLGETQERCCALELEVMEARAKWREFEDVAGDAPLLRAFAAQLRQLQDSNLVLQDKFDQSCVERDDALARLAQAREQGEAEQAKVRSLSEVLQGRQELIDKLERQKLVNAKEIEYLREQLKSVDPIAPTKAAAAAAAAPPHASQEEEELRQRVKQLEETRATLEAQLRQRHEAATPAKRPRPSSPRRSPAHSLDIENARLLAHTKTLEGRVCALEAELQQQQRLEAKRQQLRVLQLRTNFASGDQAIKQETLDVLRRENEALLAGASGAGAGASVPRAVFERQVHDQLQLEAKVDQLTKRMTRLRELYARKSCDILLTISKFFGYSVEFLPSAVNPQDLTSLRIKLTSKYLGDAHLIIDVQSKLLKASGLDEFRELCGRLVASWVKGKDQIPCFLGALNLSLYDATT